VFSLYLNQAYESFGLRLKEKPSGTLILPFLMSHTLRHGSVGYAAVMKDEGRPGRIVTDGGLHSPLGRLNVWIWFMGCDLEPNHSHAGLSLLI
jgi:hypothetical protein